MSFVWLSFATALTAAILMTSFVFSKWRSLGWGLRPSCKKRVSSFVPPMLPQLRARFSCSHLQRRAQSLADLPWVIAGLLPDSWLLLDGGAVGANPRRISPCRRQKEIATISKCSRSLKGVLELRRVLLYMTSPSQGTWRTDRSPTGLRSVRFCTGVKMQALQLYRKQGKTTFCHNSCEVGKTREQGRGERCHKLQILRRNSFLVLQRLRVFVMGPTTCMPAPGNKRSFNLAFERTSAQHVESR